MMKTRQRRNLITVALGLVAVSPVLAQTDGEKPNVVFILADNVGYGDLGPAPKVNFELGFSSLA